MIGLHTSSITEVDYEGEDEAVSVVVASNDKRVHSEDTPYVNVQETVEPSNKKTKCDSETVASLSEGNQGFGSALIICQYVKLMHYINEFDK